MTPDKEENVNRFRAIVNLVGGSISGTSEGTDIKYNSGQTPPTEVEIDTEYNRLNSEWDAQEYARERVSAYPSTGDQLDMMYKDTKNSTTTHADAVEAVKTKWPKDNSGPVE
mgnify:CR=1 FL=1